MVGRIVGTVAYLSVLALLWLLIARAQFSVWALGAGIVVFLLVGAFATFEPAEWQKRARS